MKQYKDITSKENSIYKLIKTLSQKKVRESNGLFLIEGNRLLEEATSRGVKIKYLIINETVENLPKINQGQDCEVLRLPNNLFKEVSDTVSPQGIIAVAEQIEISLADIIIGPNPLVVVLNGVQDPGNLGTIIRTSAAAGATAVLLPKGNVDLFNSKVIRSTMGSLFQVPIVDGLDDEEAVKWLNHNLINIIVADLDSEEYYYSVNLKEPFALVIGNENRGPNDVWRKAAYKQIKIPILGSAESLNASVAAGIILYEAVRQRWGK
jgi:TrmH family RNA methyltransferase